jgi:hypothetical protein
MSHESEKSDDDITEIARRIERYLESHPNAADSAEGILRWWLARQQYEESISKVERALELLLHDGTVRKHVLIDGQVLYVGSKRAPEDTH